MKKIPTIFERDWSGNRSLVVNVVNPKAQWVFDGDGHPTKKIDGTSCMIEDGKIWKRREIKNGSATPEGFLLADRDEETGKTVGWMPVGDGPEDAAHREAFTALDERADGTYELVGPKVQGNPEGYEQHTLVSHESPLLMFSDYVEVPRDFEGLRSFFEKNPTMEGVVWHHQDGRMAKIKLRDFGIRRK